MTDLPEPPIKNPERVPDVSQVDDPVGRVGPPGIGVQITKSFLNPGRGQTIESERLNMSEQTDTIDDDGIYEDNAKNRFQYRKGQIVGPGQKKNLKRVGDFPEPEPVPGTAEYEQTKADAEPQNKKDQPPDNKSAR